MIGDRRSTCSRRGPHGGFTLVELLVTLTIVGILASAVLFAMAAATESAKAAKTRTMIAKISPLLMERWESYRTRRVPLSTQGASANQATKLRLAGLRELMRIELPDRWSDVTYTPQMIQRTALAQAYRRRFQANITNSGLDLNDPNDQRKLNQYQTAECLYLIISMATGGGESMEQFSASDIGDVDGDGFMEFIDAWGNPIAFLRWPGAFVSDLHTRDMVNDHDPFDPFQRQQEAYRLVPLVYSAGSDEEYDIQQGGKSGLEYGTLAAGGGLNPYDSKDPDSGDPVLLGAPMLNEDGTQTEGWVDNVHNHVIGSN